MLSRRAFLAASALAASGCGRSSPRVVVYCAQDREFAEGVFADFTRETGVEVVPRYDTEANKSVGLYHEIVAEGGRPRCDVFWNNEIVSTIRLARRGLLAPLDVDGPAGYPAWARGGTWHAFAARARVLVVNRAWLATLRDDPGPRDLLALGTRRGAVMARPQYGTTATQTAALFATLGPEETRGLYLRAKALGLALAPGNKQVAEWVAAGRTPRGEPAHFGVTDTDDALTEVWPGKKVGIEFPSEAWAQLFIPNTLCIPAGCRNPEAARRLVAHLLSPGVEKRLAEGPGGQYPLNADVKAEMHPALRVPEGLKRAAVDWEAAADQWDAAQEFVAREFAVA